MRLSEKQQEAGRPDRDDTSGDGLLAAFFVPVMVLLIIFIQRGIFPFGEESFLRTDMYHQYAPFFSEFQYKLTHGGSLLYSWDVGMGVNFSAAVRLLSGKPFKLAADFMPEESCNRIYDIFYCHKDRTFWSGYGLVFKKALPYP